MSEVEGLLKSALDRCGFAPEAGINSLGLELTPHADLASSVAFRRAPVLKKSPAAIAGEIHQAIPHEFRYVEKVELAGPYLNFFVNRAFLNKRRLYRIDPLPDVSSPASFQIPSCVKVHTIRSEHTKA